LTDLDQFNIVPSDEESALGKYGLAKKRGHVEAVTAAQIFGDLQILHTLC